MLWKPLATWLVLAVCMILNGTIRELLYAPVVGSYPAHVISSLIGIAIIAGVTYIFIKRQTGLPQHVAWRVGALWVGLTVGFEFPFGHFVDGASWQTLLAEYNPLRGRLWSLVLLTTALAPPLWNRHFAGSKRTHGAERPIVGQPLQSNR